jgi:hypothetical protein
MLNVLRNPSPPVNPLHPRKVRHEPISITAQKLAKGKFGPRLRAQLAAAWINGDLTITDPTVALAARMFDVSAPTIADAIDNYDNT